MELDTQHKKALAIGGIALVLITGIAILLKRKGKKDGGQSKNKRLIGKAVHTGDSGYVNVRKKAEVDNENWLSLDFGNNLLKEVRTDPVGTIREVVKGKDGLFWYNIALARPVGGQTTGYVREDVVKIQH